MFSKFSKKFVAVALVLAVAFSCASIAAPDASAAKAKLNKKSISLTAGDKSVTLTASAKAKWATSNKAVAAIKASGKKCTVTGVAKGSATITATIGKEKVTCKVKVAAPKSGKVIYDLAKETGSDPSTGESWAAPCKSPYSEFKYNGFRIWLCRATFYDPANGGVDYRGKKINISITVKNSGKNDLAELGFCFNYTSPQTYPFAYHVIDSKLRASIAKKAKKSWSFNKVKAAEKKYGGKTVEGKIKKGKTYTYNFSFTIPKNAMNGDKDPDTNINYPIMFYIPNLKDNCPYQNGDEITVLKAKFTLA